jgi:putative spermidine/putrescine transport system ATP-binding protein
MAHVQLEDVSKRFGSGPPAVDGLSLSIEKAEFLALLGPSGCGKTTTLRMLAGLTELSAGRIVIGGADVTALPPYRRNMGLVFQNYALFPHMTVAENVGFGLEMRNLARDQRRQRVAEILALVRMDGLEHRKPRELSGGQQQRVALARALIIQPDVLLLDESLSNLDAKLREEMRVELRDIQRRLEITTVFVTHDQIEALSMCDRVAVMERGKIAQIGAPEDVYERPANPFVANFVGRINIIRGVVRNGRIEANGVALHAPAPPAQAASVEIMVRPHRIAIVDAAAAPTGENQVAGTVRHTTYVGDMLQVAVETPLGRLVAERGTSGSDWHGFKPGAAVTLAWRGADTLVFSAAP